MHIFVNRMIFRFFSYFIGSSHMNPNDRMIKFNLFFEFIHESMVLGAHQVFKQLSDKPKKMVHHLIVSIDGIFVAEQFVVGIRSRFVVIKDVKVNDLIIMHILAITPFYLIIWASLKRHPNIQTSKHPNIQTSKFVEN